MDAATKNQIAQTLLKAAASLEARSMTVFPWGKAIGYIKTTAGRAAIFTDFSGNGKLVLTKRNNDVLPRDSDHRLCALIQLRVQRILPGAKVFFQDSPEHGWRPCPNTKRMTRFFYQVNVK